MGYGFDWAWSGLGLVFMGLGWAVLRIFEPMTNTGPFDEPFSSVGSHILSAVCRTYLNRSGC